MVVNRIFPEAEGPPEPASRPAHELERVGGSLALDFANTVGGTRVHPKEYLTSYGELVAWSEAAGAVAPEAAERLRARAGEDPDAAEAAWARALELRETIYRIFDAVADGRPVQASDLEALNERLGPAMAELRVTLADGGFGWRAVGEGKDLEAMLAAVARDAAELLVSGDLERVKQCGGEDCAWLFVDESRNRSRRWCDMADCGNRAKQRRHYRRKRSR